MRRWRQAARAAVGAGGGPAPPAFAYSDIPDQLIRISSVEASLSNSGGTLTGVTDVSSAGESITVASSPTYTTADANLNGQPSFGPGLVQASGVDATAIQFIAFVGYVSGVATAMLVDGRTFWPPGRIGLNRDTSGRLNVYGATGPTVETVSAGRKRALVPLDGATTGLWNGSAIASAISNPTTGTTGLTIGSRYNDAEAFDSVAFFLACSSVPSAALRTALEAKLLADYG